MVIYRFAKHGKRANGWNQQPSVQQALQKLFPSTRGRGRGDENRKVHRVGAGESSTSTIFDTNTSFAKASTTKRIIAEI